MSKSTRPLKKELDPVCGMRFRPEKAATTLEHEGRLIYFCAEACRRQFEEDPDRYPDPGDSTLPD